MLYITFAGEELLITKSTDCHVSLSVNYLNHTISEVTTAAVQKSIGFYSLIGLKHIDDDIFLLVSEAVQEITCLGLSQIYEIKSTRWIAIAPFKEQQIRVKQHQEELESLSAIFQNGSHYYSQTYDLSAPFLFNKLNNIQQSTRQYYDQFIWNENLAKMDGKQDQQQVALFESWCCRIIQGSVQEYAGPFCNRSIIRYVLISRKSHKKAGTRFYARGIDDEGNVANFVQTEQIAILGDLIFTHVQVRGSVPAFFSQVGINGLSGETIIERTEQLTRGAFERHFRRLQQIYGRVVAINLLSLKKEEEKNLTVFFEGLVNAYGKETSAVGYRFFDFHQECKSDNFSKTQNLINQVQEQIGNLMFNCYKVSEARFLCEQGGVFRTNCLDCLDRTNYVQSRLALRSLRLFLIRFGDKQTANLTSGGRLLDFPVNEQFPILRGFNGLWADNGEILSLLYTGIGSTHTDITRTGERNFLGTVSHKFKSLRRFYEQFRDHRKHKAIKKLVCPSSPRLSSSGMSSFQTALLFSFDVSDQQEQVLGMMKRQTERGGSKLIVCYVYRSFVGDFWNKIKQLFSTSKQQLSKWQSQITNKIGNEYVKIVSLMDNHSWIGVFCVKQATRYLSDIKSESLTSQIGSAEVLLVKLKLEDSSFVFAGVNCPTFDVFLKVFDEIHQKGFQISKLGLFESASFLQLDYRVVLGNTGSRVLLKASQFPDVQSQLAKTNAKRDRYLQSKVLSRILDYDQLSMEESRSRTRFLREYSEGSLEFIPAQNRMLFWNQQAAVLKIRDYCKIGQGSIGATLDYEISKEEGRE